MRVNMMLADHAQVADGKLFISGGGWSITGPQPTPFAVVLEIKVPWNLINTQRTFTLTLIDADGEPFLVQTPEGERPLRIEGQFMATPAPGVKPGSELATLAAINMPPQQWLPGTQYEWRLEIDGKSEDDWRLPFQVRPAARA
jgi:hypothetical protein